MSDALTRRRFLLASGAVVLGAACGGEDDDPERDAAPDLGIPPRDVGPPPPGPPPPGPFRPDAAVAQPPGPFSRGVQVGDATHHDARVSVWSEATDVALAWDRQAADGQWTPAGSTPATPGPWREVVVDGLSPDTRYRVVAKDAAGRPSPPAHFRTALAADARRPLRFAATCCLGANRPWPSLRHAAERELDFFCLLGDTIYADWGAPASFEQKWADALQVDGLRALFEGASVIATWDDHEVVDDWTAETVDPAQLAEARAAFRKAIPQGRGPDGASIWRSLRWGEAAEIFVLDTHSERAGTSYVSEAQLEWLAAGIEASTAAFKIVLNSVPITDWSVLLGPVELNERWEGFPEQRRRLLDRVLPVPGVVWLAGDFHYGGICQVEPPGRGPVQWEILCGPGGSPIDGLGATLEPVPQIPVLVKAHNTVVFEADPATGRLRVDFVGDSGRVLATRTLELG
jgi:alkaline phosphatase D